MAADYDKLFRPHEGMEAPDDMAAQPFFDPSASFPPAPHRQTYRSPTARLRPRRPTTCRSGSCRPRRRHPHPHLRLRQLRCRSPQESRPRRNRPHLNHPHPPMPIAGPEPAPPKPPTPPMPIAGPAPTPTESQLRPPDHRHHKRQPERRSNRNHRAPRTLARATSTPAHRTSTALGKDANRRTPARSVQTVCVPGRTTDPACPPTLPTCAPGSPLSHRHRTKRREGSNWSIHPGAAAGRGSIRRAARPRNGALASAVGPTEIVSGSAHPPRADRTSPQPLAAAQLRSACRATRPPRFSRPTCRGAT